MKVYEVIAEYESKPNVMVISRVDYNIDRHVELALGSPDPLVLHGDVSVEVVGVLSQEHGGGRVFFRNQAYDEEALAQALRQFLSRFVKAATSSDLLRPLRNQ